jgi:hypothetical protein
MMKLEYPIERIHGNLALTKEREVLAFYTIPYFSTSPIDVKQKEEMKQIAERTLRKLKPNQYFELSLVPRDLLLGERLSELSTTLWKTAQKSGQVYLQGVTDSIVREMELPYKYIWLLVVHVVKDDGLNNFKALVQQKVEAQANQLMGLFDRKIRVEEDWAEDYHAAELGLRQILSALKPVALTEDQLFYFQRLQYLPYIPHRYDEVLMARKQSNVTDTMIYANNLGELQFVSEYGTSFGTFLPVGKTNGLLTNNHLGEIVQTFNFPVGLKIKAQFPDLNASFGYKTKMSQAMIRTKSIVQETVNTGNVLYDRILIGRQSLNDLAKKMEQKEPIVEFGVFLFIAASSRAQLKLRVKTVLNALSTPQMELERARLDQPYLFQALLYGSKIERTSRFWLHSSSCAGFAQFLPFTTTKSGSESGFPLGRVDSNFEKWEVLETAIHASRQLVLYHPMLASKEGIAGKVTKNLLSTITGMTGSGKSILAQTQFLQAVHSPIKSLYIDPKRAIRKQWMKVLNDSTWRNQNPALAELIERINFVTLDHQQTSNHGVLDPIVFLSPEDALTVGKTMLKYLGEGSWSKIETTAISKAVKSIVKRRIDGETVGFMHVIELLRNDSNKKVREAGEYLFETIDGSLLSLAFSYGQVQGISFEEHATVLEVAELELPDSDSSEELTEDERNSVALMMALGTFCKRFGSMNDEEETIEFMDEVWVIMTSKEGKKIIKSMKRVGRSQKNKLVLISQSVNDVKDSDDTTGVGERFCFYEDGEEEEILRTLKLEVTPLNIQWIRNMNQGQCVYLDVFGRINRISIEVPPAWLELFNPEKDSAQSKLEKVYQQR